LPPTSEQPGYDVLYRILIVKLNNDMLLEIFNFCRLDDEENWNLQHRWCKLAHVCRRWRYLIYDFPSLLNMRLTLTNGSPNIDTLCHLPPLPLVIAYRDPVTPKDEESILLAFQQRERIHQVMLQATSPSLQKLLVHMHDAFPRLEQLSLLSTTEQITALRLPGSFLAPKLRRLIFSGVGLPTEFIFSLLTSAVALVSFTLTNVRSYLPPDRLLAPLQSLSQLAELSISYPLFVSSPPSERELRRTPITRVTLPTLKRLTFQGLDAYVESLVSRVNAPFLERLGITLFRRAAIDLPHLSHFISRTKGLIHPVAGVSFGPGAVSIVIGHRGQLNDGAFSLYVKCKEFDRQIDSASQVCGALMPVLSIVEELTLACDEHTLPADWRNNAVDRAVWRGLLLPFGGVRKLGVGLALIHDLSRALEPDDAGLLLELLPDLQEIDATFEDEPTNNALVPLINLVFAPFIDARQLAGHSIYMSGTQVPHAPPTESR
jgi:F-box-like